MSSSADVRALLEFHAGEAARIRRQFETTGDGASCLAARTALLDSLLSRLHRNLLGEDTSRPEGFALLALGGYGRRELFPHSDIDLLFLCENTAAERDRREPIAAIGQRLWDLRLKVSPATRTLAECGQFHSDDPEFSISLLDARLLSGDRQLFDRLRNSVIPGMAARDRGYLVRALQELTRARHAKHASTIFHLEPNIKDAPGGWRDYSVARWLALVWELSARRAWVAPESLWPAGTAPKARAAYESLVAVRCFLHYRRGRDDNVLTYELQDAAAALGIGVPGKRPLAPADWMRGYFANARAIEHLAVQLAEEIPASRSSLYEAFAARRSRLSNADFSVARERIYLRQPAMLEDPAALLRVFEFLARHGVALSAEAERQIQQRVARLDAWPALPGGSWELFRPVLIEPHAGQALRAMHRTGIIGLLFPEFRAIDALVIRDFYHRYTVDEHSFLAIDSVHRLRQPESEGERKFQEIFAELEQPELLLLALLLHDVGKGLPPAEGIPGDDHVRASVEAAEGALARLPLPPEDRDTVRSLIANHLEMSATMQRRDLSDPGAVRGLARVAGTPERLKMLCLLTYADIRSVHPEALTPWKAELLWRLYAATANDLSRSVDEERYHAAGAAERQIQGVLELLSARAHGGDPASFLEGFPRRYFASHSAEQIATHYDRFLRLAQEPVQLDLARVRHQYSLTLLTRDRPKLFATMAGALYAWGMSITKAEAYASRAGIVLDTFHFIDLFRTLELNPSERDRLIASLLEVLAGKQDLQALLAWRSPRGAAPGPKIRVPTVIRFDDTSSAHSTILEILARDRPGLLYHISSVVAEFDGNIEVALIDTEGPKAIDVFYLTAEGKKLDSEREAALAKALADRLE